MEVTEVSTWAVSLAFHVRSMLVPVSISICLANFGNGAPRAAILFSGVCQVLFQGVWNAYYKNVDHNFAKIAVFRCEI